MDARAAPHLDLILAPHRSLTPAGFWAVMGVLIAANFVAGVMFLALGAWPVLGFLGLDVVLVEQGQLHMVVEPCARNVAHDGRGHRRDNRDERDNDDDLKPSHAGQ